MRALLVLVMLAGTAAAVAPVTPPREALGFNLGDDYHVANYTQLEAYWKKLASESDRMKLVDIGATGEGRPQYMAIVSSPENIRNLPDAIGGQCAGIRPAPASLQIRGRPRPSRRLRDA